MEQRDKSGPSAIDLSDGFFFFICWITQHRRKLLRSVNAKRDMETFHGNFWEVNQS